MTIICVVPINAPCSNRRPGQTWDWRDLLDTSGFTGRPTLGHVVAESFDRDRGERGYDLEKVEAAAGPLLGAALRYALPTSFEVNAETGDVQAWECGCDDEDHTEGTMDPAEWLNYVEDWAVRLGYALEGADLIPA